MTRKLTPQSSLENFKNEAKRWLRRLRDQDPVARARLIRAHPHAGEHPRLRDVQHALAREHGFPGWIELKNALSRLHAADTPRAVAIQSLLAAANRGDATQVREVLDQFPDIVNERAVLPGHTGQRTALHFAINSLSEDGVDVLLSHGADPNIRDEGDLAMPLHFAAEKGHLGIVHRLIEHGADPIGTGDYHELDVIGWATCFGRADTDLVDYLLSHGARHTIFSAVATGATNEIRALVADRRTDLDRPMDGTNRRRRPLHLAVIKAQPDSLKTLLELGADVETEDAAGLTPLDQAALSGEQEMVRYLLDRGAELRLPAAVALDRREDIERLLRDEPGSLQIGGRWETLLIRASETASGETIDALVRGGASVNVSDDTSTAVDRAGGYTALHAAAFHGNAGAVRALMRHGADPARREDKYWSTPVGWASYAGHTETRDILLTGSIDIFDAISFDRLDRLDDALERAPSVLERPIAQYVSGDPKPWIDPAWTPLAFAVAHDKADAVVALMDRGADVSVRDSDGRSMIELGAARGRPDIVTLLERNKRKRD